MAHTVFVSFLVVSRIIEGYYRP